MGYRQIRGWSYTVVDCGALPLAVHVGLGADRRSMRALLLDVHPVDPLALGGAAVVLFAGAWLASSGSARRAAVVEPADVLRQ